MVFHERTYCCMTTLWASPCSNISFYNNGELGDAGLPWGRRVRHSHTEMTRLTGPVYPQKHFTHGLVALAPMFEIVLRNG